MAKEFNWHIEWRDPNDLTPYGYNAKLHDPEQVKNIANSISRFGWQQPAVATKDGTLIIGHGRRLAAIRLGVNMPVKVIEDDLSETDIRELRIADNKTNESPWDFGLLTEEIRDLDFEGFDFDFMAEDDGNGPGAAQEAEEDDYDFDTPVEPKARLGDIFQLGDHRLMCGDSTDPAAVAALMDGEKANMVFTDPPYGVAIGDKNAVLNSVQPSGRCTENIENDAISEDELYGILKQAFINVRENCRDDAVYFVTSPQNGSLGLMMMVMMKDAGLPVRHILIWVKNSATFSIGRMDYDYQHEPIFYTWTKSHNNRRNGEYRTTIWHYDKPRKCDLHPTMKPVPLVANAIFDGSDPGDIVLDAFGGSGTTIIAAEQTGRKARMMELDPKYVDVIIARWEEYTGKKAVLLNG